MAVMIEVENAELIDFWRKDHSAGLVFEDGETVVHVEMSKEEWDELLDTMLETYNYAMGDDD